MVIVSDVPLNIHQLTPIIHFSSILGAGFYLNATAEKWKNWRMYDYVVKELPKVLSENFEQLDTSRASISGHSMGGHGALTIYLKNLDKYKVLCSVKFLISAKCK